jgi:hypothetical protein
MGLRRGKKDVINLEVTVNHLSLLRDEGNFGRTMRVLSRGG